MTTSTDLHQQLAIGGASTTASGRQVNKSAVCGRHTHLELRQHSLSYVISMAISVAAS